MAAAGGPLVAVKSVPVAFRGKTRKSANLKCTENAEKQRGSPRKRDCGCDILLGACRARSVSPAAVPPTPPAPASLPPSSPQERHGLHSNRPPRLTSMEEDVILQQLSSGEQTAGRRVEAIKATRGHIHSNPGKLLFKKRNELLTAVVEVLEKDARRDVKVQCVQLVCDIVQIPDPELDRFRQAVLPGLLSDLKDESPAVRKELVQTLHKCLKYSHSPEKMLSTLVEHGLESPEASVRTATTVILPILLNKDFNRVDLYDIIEALTKKFTNVSGSSGPNDPVVAFSTLDYIRQHVVVGQEEFNAYLKRLPPGMRRGYNRFIDDNFEQFSLDPESNNNNSPRSAKERGRYPSPRPTVTGSRGSPSLNDAPLILSPLKEHSGMKYGIVPLDLHSRLLDLKDYKARTHAVEELKSVVSHTDLSSVPSANVLGLIGFLCSLLDDSNFKVTHSTLEILNLLVVKLGRHVERFLRAMVTTAVKVLGDNKAVTKQEYMKVYMGLMKNAGPQKLLDLLLENVKHRNSKVREEVINIIIASLLTHPSEDFDLPKLCFAVAPALADGKRKVRHAALEVFAVLASSMGSGKMQPLVKAVDQVELHEDVDGLMAAVQARLARRTLPKLTAHGLVEYAVPIASSAHGRASQQVPQGADTEWLLGGGRTSSATSNRVDTEREPHQSHRSTSPQGEETTTHRRVLSASKGKNKLPWENTNTPTKTPFQPAKAPNDTDAITKEQVSQVPQSPKLRRSATPPANDELFITRKSAVKPAKQGNVQAMNLENSSSLTGTGAAEWHQPRISRKQGLLGYSRSSGSVDSDLQFLGTSSQLEKAPLHASLNLSAKPQRGLYSHPSTEHTLSGPNSAGGGSSSSIASQGVFILPSYPLSSLGSGQLHTTPPRKGTEDGVGFSNTWPSKPLDGTSNSSPRKRLPSSRTDNTQDLTQEKHSPVPLKPALVRTPSSRRGINGTKPVPPIPRGPCLPSLADGGGRDPKKAGGTQESGGEMSLALDLSELDVKDDEPDHEEVSMMSSLRSLRYSAAKKRAKLSGSPPVAKSPDSALKLELTLDFSSLASSTFTSPISESGIYSPPEPLSSPLAPTPPTNTNTLRNHRTMSESFNPFAARPRLAATPDIMKSTRPVEYSPNQGVSFRDRATSDVSVVGKRMGYANGAMELEEGRLGEPSLTTAKIHRGAKPTKGSPASLGNTQQQNNHEVTSASGMHEDSVVIVGKGVFGSPTASLTYSQAMLCSAENGDSAGKHGTETPPAIYGKSVHQNSHGTFESSDQAEREVTVAISKSARDKMRRRKNRAEREQLLREQERKERLEESLRERLRAIEIDSSPDDLSVNGGVLLKSKAESVSAEITPLSPPPLKLTPSLRKARSPSSDEVSAGPQPQRKQGASSVPRTSETVEPSDVRPFSKPEQALPEALRLMADDDWEKKIEGIGFVRSLSIYHPDVLATRLHDIALAMIREVKNLRSGVSRVAVLCLGDMFTHLKTMEQELDGTVRVLLHKAGESNTFIREDVDKALGAMVSNVTPARALCALIAGGSSHLNSVVRKCTALHLSGLVERMGPGRLLSGIRDVTDRLLPAVAKFTQDSSPETRYYGRQMIYLMMSHQDFDKVLEKYLLPKDLPYIKDTVHTLRLKGLGEIPQDAPSARGRRSLPGSGTIRASSNTREPHSSIAREPGESTWKPAVRNLVDNHEFIKQLTGTLNSKDFRERVKGIHQLVSECETNQDLVVSNMFPIFDAFKTRLHDSNSKVSLMALESLQKIILLLGNHLSQVVYILVPAIVDTNLNSKNSAIYTAAINALHCLSEQLDNSMLLQPFCTKAQYLTGRAKQDMTEKVADLVTELYPRKPQLVEQRVLPLLWHLVSNVSSGSTLPGKGSSMRGSTAKLCQALSAHMGDSNLLSLAANKSPQTSKNVLELLEITT
ncbi:TOG array regulator of axonemal microtubules protein 1-like isoform X2 [Polyodon spathula]|uniref:TOG array regulator of axonemal microtubules protein 1-like isoform X2 n=1 Tax=Polyodon spathula TaxID=7913 RepID=UPI001B7D967F|nr:TOG array regulator of axonemal microtubules protein 1-like isoform X2 [Polyodon spathula]